MCVSLSDSAREDIDGCKTTHSRLRDNKATIHAAADDRLCLDALNGTVDGPGAVWTCNGGANQEWNVAQLGNGMSMWGSTHNGTR